MNSLTYLKYKLTKKSNSFTNHCDNTCGHCDNLESEKMKKCQECGERKVCKECYYNGEILCKECDIEYTKQMEKLVIKSKVKSCDYCKNEKQLKSKKCQDCGERKVCSDCYYEKELPLCKCCDDKLMAYYEKIEKAMKPKYDFTGHSYNCIEECLL